MPLTLPSFSLPNQLEFNGHAFPYAIMAPTKLSLDDACGWIKANISTIESQLAKSGAILFRGFAIDSAEAFDQFSAAFGYPSFTYKESLSNAVRINFTERVFTANEAPKDVEIYLHHEMAQTPISPDKLFFFCKSAALRGGATPICRSDQLYQALLRSDPDCAAEFKVKGLRYTTHMPAVNDHQSGQGRSWMNTLNVDSKDAAEAKLKQLGYSWQWQTDHSLKAVTPVLPAVKILADGTQVFYNQLIAAYMGWKGVKDDPSRALSFGDGSPISVDALKHIVELSHDFTFDIPWQDGDVALVDNKLTMHGRRPFTGERPRQVFVALATAAGN